MEDKIIILKMGQKLRSKLSQTVYEIKSIKDHSVGLISEDGIEYILVPVACITSAEFEPVYN
jgi:hypothetical protein